MSFLYQKSEENHEHSADCPCCSGRRQFLRTALVATCGILLPHQYASAFSQRDKVLRLRNPNTGENISVTYFTPEYGYIHPSLEELNLFFRDFRQDQIMAVDVKMINILHYIQTNLNNRELILRSGYRSPKTNAMLGRASSNVAKNSYHMKAQAADIGVNGVSGRQLAVIARQLRAGGIGTGEGFIHVDSGPVREWRY